MQIKATGQGIWLLVIKRLQVFKWREAAMAGTSDGLPNDSQCTYFEAKSVIKESSEVYSLPISTAVKILTKPNEYSTSYTLASLTMEFMLIVILGYTDT